MLIRRMERGKKNGSETRPNEREYQLLSDLYISVENGGACKSLDWSACYFHRYCFGDETSTTIDEPGMKAPLACVLYSS